MGPYGTIQDHAGPYGTIQNLMFAMCPYVSESVNFQFIELLMQLKNYEMDYLGVSLAISDRLRLSLAISIYLYQVSSICGQVVANFCYLKLFG